MGIQHREHSQWYSNSVVWWQMRATLVVNIIYKVVESLCYISETNVTLCINSI